MESCTHGDHFLLASIAVLVTHIVVFSWTRLLEVVDRDNRTSCRESARQLARATDKVAHLTGMDLLNGEKMHKDHEGGEKLSTGEILKMHISLAGVGGKGC